MARTAAAVRLEHQLLVGRRGSDRARADGAAASRPPARASGRAPTCPRCRSIAACPVRQATSRIVWMTSRSVSLPRALDDSKAVWTYASNPSSAAAVASRCRRDRPSARSRRAAAAARRARATGARAPSPRGRHAPARRTPPTRCIPSHPSENPHRTHPAWPPRRRETNYERNWSDGAAGATDRSDKFG